MLMPRHRPVGRPRHRAKRKGFWPARGARSEGARREALPAVGPPGGLTSESLHERAKGHRTRANFGRMARSAMLTPWFAVSAGIVIAASLTLARPHPALTFPPTKSGRCAQAARCASPSTPPTGPAPAIKQEARLPLQRSRAKVEYRLLRRNRDHFVAVISIVGQHSLNNWRLRFVMPGATINDIWGATAWQPEGHGGVIVTGSRSPWQKSGDNEARIIVFGTVSTGTSSGAGRTGRLGWPRDCEFGNQRCTFRALPRDTGHEHAGHKHGSGELSHRRSADGVFGD
jgi:hypothetical protein